jgi:hypothetical protein
MSTLVELMPQVAVEEAVEAAAQSVQERLQAKPASGSLAAFAEAQIRGLVQQIFLNKRNKRARQVVFSAVDQQTDVASLCMQIGESLSQQDSGTTCVVEALPPEASQNVLEMNRAGSSNSQKRFGVLRDASQQLSSRLWFMPRDVLLDGSDRFSAVFLRGRLAELRLEFDYTIFQGPAAALYSEAAMLGSLCDGIVLVLRANSTRRVAAKRVKEILHAADARLLGTVLSERTFPIPGAIYERL